MFGGSKGSKNSGSGSGSGGGGGGTPGGGGGGGGTPGGGGGGGGGAPAPAIDPQRRELVTLESKRLGQRVHQLFNGGKYREALQVAEEQMKLLRDTYGVNHHEYATAMNNVATLYQALGRYTEAEPLLLEASKIQQRTLGHDHPHTVASLSNLATVYEAMGQAERAAAMHSLVTQMKRTWEEKQKKGGAQKR